MTKEEIQELFMQKERECSKLCSKLSNPFSGEGGGMSEDELFAVKKRARELDEEIYHLSRGRYDEYLQLLKERETQD